MSSPKAGHKHSTHKSHASEFVTSLTRAQRNSLRLLLTKDAAAELHHLLDVQKAVTRAVHDVEHKLELAKHGRTIELFRDQHHHVADIREVL